MRLGRRRRDSQREILTDEKERKRENRGRARRREREKNIERMKRGIEMDEKIVIKAIVIS